MIAVPLFIAYVLLWIASGILAAGRAYAHFQRGFPRLANEMRGDDTAFAITIGLLGPLGLAVALLYGRHGWLMPGKKP